MKKTGISLIVLVITIIVLAIIATVVIVLTSPNDIIAYTRHSAFETKLNTYLVELNNYHAKELIKSTDYSYDMNLLQASQGGDIEISTILPSITAEDEKQFVIINGKLRIKITSDFANIELAQNKNILTDMYEVNISSKPDQQQFTYDVLNGQATILGVIDSNLEEVIIPYEIVKDGLVYTVTSIEENAFKNNSNLKSVAIPNSITSIGQAAFYNCKNISSIIIPSGVTEILNSTFLDAMN